GGGWMGLANARHDRGVDRNVAFATARRHDHVGMVEQLLIAGDRGVGQRKTCGIHPDPLPSFHLPLIAFFRDLLVEAHRRQLMHDVGCKALVAVGRWVDAPEMLPSLFHPLAQTGEKADASDPHLTACGHFANSLAGKLMRSAHSHNPARSSGLGYGTSR